MTAANFDSGLSRIKKSAKQFHDDELSADFDLVLSIEQRGQKLCQPLKKKKLFY